MAETEAWPVSDIAGWQLAPDQIHVLLTLKQPEGHEATFAIPQYVLHEIILALCHATEVFQAQTGICVKDVPAMGVSKYQFGKDDSTGDFFVRFRLQRGGHLAFMMDRSMAEQLTEAMNAMVLNMAIVPPPGIPRN